MRDSLTADRLKQLISYNPQTGEVVRISSIRKTKIGKSPKSKNEYGHLQMHADGHNYSVHRLIWLYMTGSWPDGLVDHIDNNPQNNVFSNLRCVSRSENAQNIKGAHADSSTGYLGVTLTSKGKYIAQISTRGVKKCLGSFDCPQKAHDAYMKAKKEIHAASTIAKEYQA